MAISFGHGGAGIVSDCNGAVCARDIDVYSGESRWTLECFIQFTNFHCFYSQYITRHTENRFTKCIFCCCQCCLSCLQNFLQYISRNAYIETGMAIVDQHTQLDFWYKYIWLLFVAIYGYSFCLAGQKAFSLLSSNALRVFAINSVGDFVLWSGKAFVVACTVFAGLDIIQVRCLFFETQAHANEILYIYFPRTEEGWSASQLGAARPGRPICLFDLAYIHHRLWGILMSYLATIVDFELKTTWFCVNIIYFWPDDDRYDFSVLLRGLWTQWWTDASVFHVARTHGICAEIEKSARDTRVSTGSWCVVNKWGYARASTSTKAIFSWMRSWDAYCSVYIYDQMEGSAHEIGTFLWGIFVKFMIHVHSLLSGIQNDFRQR